ncbi:MAG: DUF2442 domain-containing protein [Spirochaetota bacterium]
MVWVTDAKYQDEYKIWLQFSDDISGIVDFEPILTKDHRKVIHDLVDKTIFTDFTIELDTLVWSNGADFAPEYLHDLCKKSKNVA